MIYRHWWVNQNITIHLDILSYFLIPKVIIDKSRGEVSLLEQDTIENVSKPIKNQKERKKNHFMQLFSEDTTMFLFIYLFYQKKRPQKLLIIGPNVFFFSNANRPKSSCNLNSCSKKISHHVNSL